MVRALTKEEFATLTSTVDEFGHLGKYMRIAAATGLRVSGALSVKLSDLYDFENKRPIANLYIKKSQLKGGKKVGSTVAAMTIKLPNWFKDYIQEYVEHCAQLKHNGDPYITLTPRDKFITVSDERIRQLLCEAVYQHLPDASGERIGTHSFRKLYATIAYECSDKSLPAVQHMLGHKSISSTGYYLKETIHKIAEVSDAVGEKLEQMLG